MIDGILSFAIRQRWLVMIGVLGMAAFGAWNFTRLPIDAVPDITNVQIQINSRAPGYSPLEVEQRITFPVETAMGGLPHLDSTRSQSRYGMSQVTVIFKDGTDIYFARQLVNERIQQVKDQVSAAVGEAMLVRIEMDRVKDTLEEKFDKSALRMAEIEALLADEMDVSAAVQLERLEELERAIAELNPDQFVRKTDPTATGRAPLAGLSLPSTSLGSPSASAPAGGSAASGPANAGPSEPSLSSF